MYIRVPCNRSDPARPALWPYDTFIISSPCEEKVYWTKIRSNTVSNDPNCSERLDVLDLPGPESDGYFQVSHLVKPPVNCPLRIAAETQTSRAGQGRSWYEHYIICFLWCWCSDFKTNAILILPSWYQRKCSLRHWFNRLLIKADNRDALQLPRLTIVKHSFLNKDVRGGDVHILPYCHTMKLSSTV